MFETILQLSATISTILTGVGIIYLIILTHIRGKGKINITVQPAPVSPIRVDKTIKEVLPAPIVNIPDINIPDIVVPEIIIPEIVVPNISGLSKASENILQDTKDRFKTTFFSPTNNPFTFYIIEDVISGYGYLVAVDENGNLVAPTKIYLCHENH